MASKSLRHLLFIYPPPSRHRTGAGCVSELRPCASWVLLPRGALTTSFINFAGGILWCLYFSDVFSVIRRSSFLGVCIPSVLSRCHRFFLWQPFSSIHCHGSILLSVTQGTHRFFKRFLKFRSRMKLYWIKFNFSEPLLHYFTACWPFQPILASMK